MQIKSVRIRNFRGHKDTSLTFEKFHAIVGENGTGKTAILEAIDFACSSGYAAARLTEQDFNLEDAEDAVQIDVEFDKPFVMKVPDGFNDMNLICTGTNFTAHRRSAASPGRALSDPFVVQCRARLLEYPDSTALSDSVVPQDFTKSDFPPSVKRSDKDDGYFMARKGDSAKARGVRDGQLMLSNQTVGFPEVFYFGKKRSRELRVGFNSTLSKLAKELNWRFRNEIDLAGLSVLWDAVYAKIAEAVTKPSDKLYEPAFERASKMFPDVLKNLELSLLSLEEPFSKSFVASRVGTNQISIDAAGSGIEVIVAVFLLNHLARLSKTVPLFLIDEPEIHLHPQLQRHLADILQQSASQVIVSTHSHHFVDLGKWKSVTRLAHGKRYPESATLATAVSGETVTAKLDRIQERHIQHRILSRVDAEMFFARKILLVEGIAELFCLPRLASLLKQELPDVSIVSCNGKRNIQHYAVQCIAFGINFHTLFDLDGKAATDAENTEVVDAIGGAPHATLPTSLEDLLGASGRRKTQDAMNKVLELKEKDVPKELSKAIAAIAKWAAK